MHRALFALAIIGTVAAGPAAAQTNSIESMTLANHLGSVLAAEEYCGFKYDQSAIAAFIEAEVAEDDLGFASMLQMQTQGLAIMQEDMNDSQKTAHCAQTQRVARSYGFVD